MPYIGVRDPFAGAKDTLSSWDKCMAKPYCKWPVIVAIVVGSLIVLTTVLCVVRCIFCGVKCATCCCSCCSCCCPSGSGSSGHKRMKSGEPAPMPNAYNGPPIAAPPVDTRPVNQQYRSHAAPAFNPVQVPKPVPEQPQYAKFESPSKTVDEDALPVMPSWKDARSTHVEEEVMPEKGGDLEMDRLDHKGSVAGLAVGSLAAAGAARRGQNSSPAQRSPTRDGYGFPPGYSDSYVSGASQRSPQRSPVAYGDPHGGQYGRQQDTYRGASPIHETQNLSPVYGHGAGYARNQPYGRHSPHEDYDQQYDRRAPQDYNQQYARDIPQDYEQPYGQPAPRRSPGPVEAYGYESNDRFRGPIAMPSHDNFVPARSPSPQYAPSGSTYYDQPASFFSGQQSYTLSEVSYPGQQTYQAFQPQEPQYSGVNRKPVNNTWKEI